MIPESEDSTPKDGGAKLDLSTPQNLESQNKYSAYISLFKAPISNKYPEKQVELSDVYDAVKGNTYNEKTVKLRSIGNLDEAKKFKASNFDYATFSGTFTARSTKSLIQGSPYICIDLDHIGNSDAIMVIKTLILDNLSPALMFISPSGDGLKIVFKVLTETATHLIYFRALQNYFEIVVGHTADPSGSDIARACFLPHDPDAYYNRECDILDYAFINTFYLQNTTPGWSTAPIIKQEKFPSSDEKIEILITWLEKTVSFTNGSRNSYVSKLAYACNRYGIPENDTRNRLSDFSQSGFTGNDINTIVRSVYKHTELHGVSSFYENQQEDFVIPENNELIGDEQSQELQTQATPLLPIDGFPCNLKDLIKECTRVYGTPQDFWAISFLQATAIALGSTYEIKDKYTNGAVLWVALIAPTGVGKSEPMDIALRPIYKIDSAEHESYIHEKKKFDSIIALTPKERKDQGIDIPKRPIQKQYIAIDSTPESLIAVHQENKRGIAIVRDEILGWILDFGRYSRSGEVQNMLSAWSEKFFKVMRKGNQSATIEKPFIPVFGGVQPEKLYELAKDGRAMDGFMQRFVFAYPDQCIKPDYNEEYLTDDYVSSYNSYITSLLGLSGDRLPIPLSKEAKQLYKEFYNHNTSLVNAESNGYARGVYQKLEIIVLRIALILHVSHHVSDKQYQKPIQPETMQSAIDITEYFRITARKVNQHIGQDISSAGKPDNRSVAQYLMKTGKITKTDLAHALDTSRAQLDRLLRKPGTVVQEPKT